MRERSESTKESEAKRLLKLREGDIVKGVRITPRINRITFGELAEDVINDYKMNGKKSLDDVERRLKKHVLPVFAARRANSIGTADVKQFIVNRQEAGASNGEINRELTAIKRAFNLGVESEKIVHKPHIPMLKENNVRKGFFERPQFEAVRRVLSEHLRPVLSFSYITGWRIPSEVLTLQWPQVDFLTGAVRLEPGTTKNEDGREFRLTQELRQVLEAQYSVRPKDKICPWVFHRNGKPIRSFYKAWHRACYKAGLPCVVEFKRDTKGEIVRYKQGKKDGEPIVAKIEAKNIPHDFRRTAVRNLVRDGVPESVAMKMTGHLTRAVFDRYNIVSEHDLTAAAALMDAADARRRASVPGMNAGMIAPFPGTLPTETPSNLLESQQGPVAQKDRAAVS